MKNSEHIYLVFKWGVVYVSVWQAAANAKNF